MDSKNRPAQLHLTHIFAITAATFIIVAILGTLALSYESQPLLNAHTDPTAQTVNHVYNDSCQPRTDWVRYIVGESDTLEALAKSLGISQTMLTEANCLPTNSPITGRTLYLPANPATSNT